MEEDKNGEPMRPRRYNFKDESDYYDWQCESDPEEEEEEE